MYILNSANGFAQPDPYLTADSGPAGIFSQPAKRTSFQQQSLDRIITIALAM